MGQLSIVHLIILLVYLCLAIAYVIAVVRILNRAGYSGWWVLLSFVPIANIIGLWQFSKASWPGDRRHRGVTDVFK